MSISSTPGRPDIRAVAMPIGLAALALAAVLAILALAVLFRATSPAKYEGVWDPGTPDTVGVFLRMNVPTGQTFSFTSVEDSPFAAVAEPAPIPRGDYHLYLAWAPANASGKDWWTLARIDRKSGRTWLMTGSTASFVWKEKVPGR